MHSLIFIMFSLKYIPSISCYSPSYAYGIRHILQLLDHAWFSSHLLATYWLCIVIILIVVLSQSLGNSRFLHHTTTANLELIVMSPSFCLTHPSLVFLSLFLVVLIIVFIYILLLYKYFGLAVVHTLLVCLLFLFSVYLFGISFFFVFLIFFLSLASSFPCCLTVHSSLHLVILFFFYFPSCFQRSS